MKKIGVLIENYFDEKELIYPYFRLQEDFKVDLIGTEKNVEYTGKSGSFKMKSNISSKEANPDDYEAIYIPGGFSPDGMRGCEDTIEFINKIHEQNKPIAAICHGPWALADAIDLKGIKMTSVPKIKNDFIHAGCEWIDEAVVIDKNIITSRTPSDISKQVPKFVEMIKNK
ncbi:type 1 glutamine amidotransferase [Anaerococcus sp. AGMB00486]|uniref:Type 1 glutamine amidotransferase n=1 Tax=Anaerococcus faecalis TaxID=2742993 RepID=A0ABX2N7N4_9FIRM|nr:type 1 glutamine amidotransferase domain-containing protein [Anaerococcus faecalis]NVF10685.1 type 1 glutamine amidotransferase [Anaerococcus faecalis]